MNLKMPDITPAQVVAGVAWIVTQAVALGVIQNDTGAWVLQLAGTAIPFAWILADAVIRHGRNKARAAQIMASGVDPATGVRA